MKTLTLPIKQYLSVKDEVALLEMQCDRLKRKTSSNPSLRRLSQRQVELNNRRKLLYQN